MECAGFCNGSLRRDRCRPATEGFAEIELVIDNRVVLKFSNETYGDSYEIVARRVADLILEVASNPCSLNGLRG
jgi:hypothetical protein